MDDCFVLFMLMGLPCFLSAFIFMWVVGFTMVLISLFILEILVLFCFY